MLVRSSGFYFFLSYCILSLLALQVMPKPLLPPLSLQGQHEPQLLWLTQDRY